MTQFCREFFGEAPHDLVACPQCSKAYAELKREEAVLASLPKGESLFPPNTLERAALDHRGRP